MSVLYRDRPHGTLEELAQAKYHPSQYGSCSPRTQTSLGCPWYDICKFRDHRDRVNGKKGPCNIAALVTLSPAENSETDVMESACFEYYYAGLWQREQQMDKTGEVIAIVAVEGDGRTFQQKENVRAHKKKDPECEACQTGQLCMKRKTVLTTARQVKPFQRLFDRAPMAVAANEAREALAKQVETNRLEGALALQNRLTGADK